VSETPAPEPQTEAAGFGEVTLGETGSVVDVRMPPPGTHNPSTDSPVCPICGNPMGHMYTTGLNSDGSMKLIHVQCPGPRPVEE